MDRGEDDHERFFLIGRQDFIEVLEFLMSRTSTCRRRLVVLELGIGIVAGASSLPDRLGLTVKPMSTGSAE